MIKSLVTGGAGFIGAHVANELIKMGHSVVVLDDLSGGFRDNVHPDCILSARNEVVHAYADPSKAQRNFGMTEGTSLEEGISKMTAWAKGAGIRKSVKFKNIEITENQPSCWLED